MCLALGARAFVIKPTDRGELMAVLRNILELV
jgi:hypothetical protein